MFPGAKLQRYFCLVGGSVRSVWPVWRFATTSSSCGPARARRRLGLAFLPLPLAAYVGLAFEVIFTRHLWSATARGIARFRNADAMLCL